MELNEIMRLIWQGLINLPGGAPEREETIRAYGALTSKLGYTPPEYLLVPRADGYTDVKFATEAPLERPVPQTYGDWVNLGEDIKGKAGIDDFKTTAEVNEHLYHISKEDEDPETAQVSKMWLTRKAGELGIK